MSRARHRKKSLASKKFKQAATVTTTGAVLVMSASPAMADEPVEVVKQQSYPSVLPALENLPSVPAAAPEANTVTGDVVVAEARKYLGANYVWGGESVEEGGFDCSGLIFRTYADLGINTPRTSSEFASVGVAVPSLDQAQAGDILHWPGHVAIYVGNGRMIESSTAGNPVAERDVYGSPTIRRILTGAEVAPVAPAPVEQPVESTETITVQPGDYLSKIAPTVGTTWQELYESNREVIGDNPDLIYPGQVYFVGGLLLPQAPATVEEEEVVVETPSDEVVAEVPVENEVVPVPEVIESTATAIISNSYGNVSARTQAAANAVFSNVSGASLITIGGTRASARDPHGHPSGNALDYMVLSDAALGDSIVNYHLANWDTLGVEYIIWEQHIKYSANGAWEWMPDRGNATQNHYDHVHVNYRR